MVSIDRCLTMASFTALVTIRQFLKKHPTLDIEMVVETVRKIQSDADGFDYVGGEAAHSVIDKYLLFEESTEGLRSYVSELVKHFEPWWLKLVPYGRDKVKTGLTDDNIHVFREAGLLDIIPDQESLLWWDKLASTARNFSDLEKLLQAREAERLTLDHEADKLKKLGIESVPKWVSIEDNTLGYDIISYEINRSKVIGMFIEVKSTKTEDIFITKNEWNNALSAKDNYCFHVWRFPKKTLDIYSVNDIKQHIPEDKGRGNWEIARVKLYS